MNTKINSSTVKLIVLILLIGGISLFTRLYAEYLWFASIDFQTVFTTILLNKVVLYVVIFVLTLLLFFLNLQLTRKNMDSGDDSPYETEDGREIIYLNQEKSPWKEFLSGKVAKWVYLGLSVFAAFIVSSVAADNWLVVQQYINRVPMGTIDPIFNKDISFYFFNLAFYKFIYSTLMTALVVLIVVVGFTYLVNASSDLIFGNWRQFTFAKSHVGIILAIIFGLKSWGYRLSSYDILFSPAGIAYGATYTDIHARLLAYKVLMVISLITAIVIVINIFVKKINWILYSVGGWLVLAVLLGGVYPTAIQKFVVQPNEFNKERPYLENAIKFTREAYNLNRAENQEFKIDYQLNINDETNTATVDNIRLWDWQPLQITYQNLQALRPYYKFNDVDIDRYVIDGEYRQVMLSAREIDQAELPDQAQTWINQRLFYTHGYGVVVSPVTEVAQEGFPQFIIKDVPPRFSTDLELKRPEIYFGERTDPYVIVNTKQPEFDYPLGNKNAYSNYEGKGGIKLDSFFKRLLFSWELKDYKMLLSSDITNDSQLLINRNIQQRIQKVAPFLGYDSDPYIVINENGALVWMIDAYTYTDKYPYSEPFNDQGSNYLRNSVKITCDAYTGELNFYIADNNDPIIQSYAKIFSDLFKPLSEMPVDLQSHIRYPVDLFMVQASMYRTFHMTDPNVFYNQEDPWLIPTEIVGDKQKNMEPYYIIMRLPGEEKAEYVLMLPFTPKSRPNMVAWMCARMDGEKYGNMLVYSFPKQETIYGPQQIESRIDQDTTISQQLSLWSQRGSSVYRGNLLVIPMNNSILYVEPLYLQADNSKLPELKRVIASFGNKVVMEPSLDQALIKLFGEGRSEPTDPTPGEENNNTDQQTVTSIEELAKLARQYYDQANQRLREGDWAGYGDNIQKLDDVIKRLEDEAL